MLTKDDYKKVFKLNHRDEITDIMDNPEIRPHHIIIKKRQLLPYRAKTLHRILRNKACHSSIELTLEWPFKLFGKRMVIQKFFIE